MLLQCKKKWKIIEAVNPQESCKHWVLMWKSCAQSELVKEWRSPPFCRNFQSGTRWLHAQRYHCWSRLCTNQSRVCTEHSARSKTTKDSTYTYHYRKGACCTCSATTTPVTPYCAQSSIPSCTLRISRQRCTRTQTHTYQRNAKRRCVHACACYYCYTLKWALINAQMCALFQSTKSTPCTIGAQTPPLPCYLHLLPQALLASICAQFTMCSCAQSFETMYIYMYLFNKWHVSLRTVHRLMCTHH